MLFLKDKIIKYSLIASVILNLLLWILFYFRIPIQVDPIALRYNIYVGINMIGAWWKIYYFPLIGLIIILLNRFLAKKFFYKDKLIARLLVVTILISQLILLTYGALIVIINS